MSHIFSELKRRNIFRVAGVYAVVGWITMQVIAVMTPALHLPGSLDSIVAVLLIAGFPIALIVAWAFELTADGISRTETVAAGESSPPGLGRKMDVAIIAGLAIVAALVIWQMTSRYSAAIERVADTPATQEAAVVGTSIAVLPFADMSAAGDQEYFSDGMAEEILSALVKVPDLQVAGRTSSFSFKGKDSTIQEIGAALKVEHVLEGSVRKQGENVRITAQLNRASDGFQLWSDTYDGTLENIFQLQDDVSRAIANALKVKLNISKGALVENLTNNKEAYDLYLKALEKMRNPWGNEAFQSAITMLERAVALDPNFAKGWLALARANLAAPYYNTVADDMFYVEAGVLAAKRALALDPDNEEVRFRLADAEGRQSGNFAKAFEQVSEAYRANNQSGGTDAYYYLATGQTRSSIPLYKRALENDPYRGDYLYNMARAQFRVGDFASAESYAQRSIDAGFLAGNFVMADIYAFKGDTQAAIPIFTKAYFSASDQFIRGVRSRASAQLYADAVYGQDSAARDQLVTMLKDAIDDPNTQSNSTYLNTLIQLGEAEMFFDFYSRNQIATVHTVLSTLWHTYRKGPKAIRQHQGFPAFAEQVGLIEIWQKHGWADLCRPNPGTDGSGGQFTCD